MDTKQLSFAIRLADTLHFGKAAEIEDIAQSGLSVQISKLELEVGFKIFDRTNRKVVLTEAGRNFIDNARATMLLMKNTITECQAISESRKGVMRVGYFGEAAGEITHLVFSFFKATNPDIKLFFHELNMTNQVQELISGKIDAALLRMPINDDRLEFDIMYDEPRVAAVPASHELADAAQISIADLVSQPFAIAGEGAPSEWASYWSLASEHHEKSRVGAQVKSISESLFAIAYGGVFDTFPLTASRMFNHPGVKYIPIVDAPRSTLALATVKGNRSPAVRSLRRCIEIILEQSISCIPEARRIRNP